MSIFLWLFFVSFLEENQIKICWVKMMCFCKGWANPAPHYTSPELDLEKEGEVVACIMYVCIMYVLDLKAKLVPNYTENRLVFLCHLQAGSVANSCNPASGRSDIGTMWGGELWLHPVHVELASALRLASTWSSWGSPRRPGCLRRGAPGQRGNPAAKSFRVDQ